MLAQQKKRDRWKLRPEAGLIFALEDLDLTFYPEEAEKAIKLWQYGWHIAEIAKQMKRNQDELAVLIMHLARQGKIRKRQNGVFGNE